MFTLLLLLTMTFWSCKNDEEKSIDRSSIMWFDTPAKEWNNALPVGNGRLGAMVFGGGASERLQLNEESVWAGEAYDFHNPNALEGVQKVRELIFSGKYGEAEKNAQSTLMGNMINYSTYQTLGDLLLNFEAHDTITDYKRTLDLEHAIATVSYSTNGISYHREVFSSAPDQGIVLKIKADQPASITFEATLSRPGYKALIIAQDNMITMKEHINDGNGVNLFAAAKVVTEGGSVTSNGGELKVANADEVTIYLTAHTDYNTEDPEAAALADLNEIVSKDYGVVKSDHITDYKHYFDRVSLSLGENTLDTLPTDQRLARVKDGLTDPKLLEQYYQFGRYMLISSSRPGSMPANLQGIWADGLYPPWAADYHININIQMNYWPAEITNLSEMHMPFLTFIDALREDGNKTAREMYGIEGAVTHFTTDAWHYTEPHGKTDWAMWPMGQAWCSTHFWEHYLFTEDRAYLEELAYPAMKDAATFCVNWLVENPKTGYLVSGPSISPENKFVTDNGDTASIVMGPTMDHMIIRHLLESTIKASELLNQDESFRTAMQNTLEKLAPVQIGSDGRLMEWTEEFTEENPGHRHISHLYGLYPASQISIKTPALLEAAKKTIDYRLSHGGGHTGWSRAWIINFFARLQDGEKAYENLLALLRKSTLDNLFDNHPPFQIDGNFGATAGITEMLLQSHTGELHLLPALPKAWKNGNIHGIVGRGGFTLDIDWADHQLKKVAVTSTLGNPCTLRLNNLTVTIPTEKGQTYHFDNKLNQL